MKLFHPTFRLFLTALLITAVLAQEEPPNCDAICDEKVRLAVDPIQQEKVRAEEWGHGVRRELDEAYNRLRAIEEQFEQMRNLAGEHERRAADFERAFNDQRGNLDRVQRDLDNSRREIEQLKHDHHSEVEDLRTKAEESTRAMGRVQFALDEANDQIKEMESARVSVNLKGIGDDVKIYWKNLLTWWTGLVLPEQKKDEDL
jgi:Skp family chaperone for outer membrane proteins